MARFHPIVIKRAYDAPTRADGTRILVDRLWPRGVRREDAALDEWRKDAAPSTELRRFYDHTPERFAEFSKRYRQELRRPETRAAVSEIIERSRRRKVTLVTATRDLEHSVAAVLATHLHALVRRREQSVRRSAADD